MQDVNVPFSHQHTEIGNGRKPGSVGCSLGAPDSEQENENWELVSNSMGVM